jgi:hypothetical protein
MTALKGWLDPRPNDFSEEGLRARFKSLQDFLSNPTFVNGIALGDGTQGTYDDTTGTTTPPTTSDVDADTFAGIDADLTQLQTDLDAAEADLVALEGDLATLDADLAALDTRLDTAESDIDAAEAAITTLNTTTIPALDTRLDDAEADIIAANAEIDAILPIETADISPLAITAPLLAANSVIAGKIAADAVTANEIAADSVTASEIAANTITAAEIAANTITANEIAADAVTASEIAANTITAAEIAANTITANEIAADAITTSELAADSVTAAELAAINLAVGKWIASTSYSAGVSGWIIEADGSAEFNDVTVRGDVFADRFTATATLLENYPFTGSTDSWTADTGSSISSVGNELVIDDTNADSSVGAKSPFFAVTPGITYTALVTSTDEYVDGSSFFAETIRFYTTNSEGSYISDGENSESGSGEGQRATSAVAPSTATYARVYLTGTAATQAVAAGVKVYESGTMRGASIDTRIPGEASAPGVRINKGVELVGPTGGGGLLSITEHEAGSPDPWTGFGPMLQEEGGVAYLHLMEGGDAVLEGDTIWIAPQQDDLRLGTNVDVNVLGAWVDYSPSHSNITVGNGTETAAYMLIGTTCHVRWRLVFGSTSAFGTSARVGLPFTPAHIQAGVANLADATGRTFPGSCLAATSDTRAPLYHPESLNNGAVNATSPFTWGTGDVATMYVCYEIA